MKENQNRVFSCDCSCESRQPSTTSVLSCVCNQRLVRGRWKWGWAIFPVRPRLLSCIPREMFSSVHLKLFFLLCLQTSSGKPSDMADITTIQQRLPVAIWIWNDARLRMTHCTAALSVEITFCQGARAKAIWLVECWQELLHQQIDFKGYLCGRKSFSCRALRGAERSYCSLRKGWCMILWETSTRTQWCFLLRTWAYPLWRNAVSTAAPPPTQRWTS